MENPATSYPAILEAISTETEIENAIGKPSRKVLAKVLNGLDEICRAFIARSPFVVVASSDAAGNLDVSPKGDPPGFVHVLDNRTIAIPERPGNRRADTFRNVLQNPKVGLIFVVPDKGETLRISGTARIVRDAWLRERLKVADRVPELALASSSEVYQTPPIVPTPENVPLCVPDVLNPRYSYGGSKLAAELIAFNYGRAGFDRVVVFRPHNVYGPDMGFEHVIPQFTLRLKKEARQQGNGVVRFRIQGSGRETRSFCHISDLVQGVMVMRSRGEHLGIYHIGTSEEVAIGDLAHRIAGTMSLEIELISTSTLAGSTPRRCPDISKLVGLGYQPRVQLNEGLPPTVRWYCENEQLAGQLQARI